MLAPTDAGCRTIPIPARAGAKASRSQTLGYRALSEKSVPPRAFLENEFSVAIGAFDPAFAAHIQIDRRMTQCAAAVTAGRGLVNFNSFRRVPHIAGHSIFRSYISLRHVHIKHAQTLGLLGKEQFNRSIGSHQIGGGAKPTNSKLRLYKYQFHGSLTRS